MAKKDDIILIIAKSFSKDPLTVKECEHAALLTISELISEHGLYDIQASQGMNWCVISKRKLNQSKEILEENFFSRLFGKKNKNIVSPEKVKQTIESTLNNSLFVQYIRLIKIHINQLNSQTQSSVDIDDGIQYDNVRIKPKAFQLRKLIKENLEKCYDFFEGLSRNPESFDPSKFKLMKESIESILTKGELDYLNALERSLENPNVTGSKAMTFQFRGVTFSLLGFSRAFNNHIVKGSNNSKLEGLKSFTYDAYRIILNDLLKSKGLKDKRDEKARKIELENRSLIIKAIADVCFKMAEEALELFESSEFFTASGKIQDKFFTAKVRDEQNTPFKKLSPPLGHHLDGVTTGHKNRRY